MQDADEAMNCWGPWSTHWAMRDKDMYRNNTCQRRTNQGLGVGQASQSNKIHLVEKQMRQMVPVAFGTQVFTSNCKFT